MFKRINRNKSKISILLAILLMLSPVCQQHVYAYDEASAGTVISSELEETDVADTEENVDTEEAEEAEEASETEDEAQAEAADSEAEAEDEVQAEAADSETEAEVEAEIESETEVDDEDETQADEIEESADVETDEIVEPESNDEIGGSGSDLADADLDIEAVGGVINDAIDDAIGGAATNIHPAVSDINTNNISSSYGGTVQDKYEVIVRGIAENVVESVFSIIDANINRVMSEGIRMYIDSSTPGQLIDAEKYSTGKNGYDQQHCWAATASNILWTTGYAQQAVNPLTGRNFASEDEVLTYFSENFTDDPGIPEDGVEWFIKGTYTLDGEVGVAKRKNTDSGNLLPALGSNINDRIVNVDTEGVNSLLSIASQGMGVLVRWIDNGALTPGAHWMTVSGIVKDKVSNTISGLIIADSDDNAVYKTGPDDFNETSYSQKQNAKQQQKNTYSVYKLSYDDGHWLLNGFASKPTVITRLYYLLDSDKTPQGGGEGTRPGINSLINSTMDQMEDYLNGNTPSINAVAQAKVDEKIVEDIIGGSDFTTEDVAIIEDALTVLYNLIRGGSLSEANLVNAIDSFMTENNIDILPFNDVLSDNNADFEAYIKETTAISEVTINGVVLAKDQYTVVTLKNGLKKIVVKNSYLKKLNNGKYKLSLNVNNSKTIETVFDIVY